MESLTPYWNAAVVWPLEAMLRFLADLTASGGYGIILMTLIIKTALLPLSLKQTSSMKAMQSLQPELAALKKKYKDRERVTQETMRLYKERGINPASGCLPMLPTMVVLFGLYSALMNLAQTDEEFQRAFWWLPRLDRPDSFTLPFVDLPLPGILPIAMAITQYFSSKMMTMPTGDPQQQTMNRMMTIIMPGMMLFWGVTFPAGLVLYWFISNVFEMVRLYFTMGPQSLQGSLSFAGFGAGSAANQTSSEQTSFGENGAESNDDQPRADAPRTDARTNGRPARGRHKRGRRSGRR